MSLPRTLGVAMPVYREVHVATHQTMLRFAETPPPKDWTSRSAVARGQPVSIIREQLAEALLAEGVDPPVDVLAWIDSDCSLEDPRDLWYLARTLDAAPPDVWMLGVPVPIQGQAWPPQLNIWPLERPPVVGQAYALDPREVTPERPWLEVKAVGFGIVLVRREAFLRLARPWFSFRLVEPGGDGAVATAGKKLVGEDVGFCDRVREAGGRILVDLSVQASHWFSAEWKGPVVPRRR
jgi:hypothetical protein